MNSVAAVYQDRVGQSRSRNMVDAGEVFTQHRVLVNGYQSQWLEDLSPRLRDLTALERGWDGYDGLPVNFHVAHFVVNLLERLFLDNLPPPSLVPGSDGSLQFEWHRNGMDIELDVHAPSRVTAYKYDHQSGEETEIELRNNFADVACWLSEMAGRG